jgi:uncharacterized membrane protein
MAEFQKVDVMQYEYVNAICAGAMAGMRTMSAPAFVSDHLSRNESEALADSPLKFLGRPRVASMFRIAAAGEMVADKLPIIPDRISPGSLAGRAASGALCGAALFKAEGQRAGVGAVIGSVSAVASAFAFYYLRRSLGRTTIVPDALLGVAEDALVLAIGRRLFPTEPADPADLHVICRSRTELS